jgi:hypothetical protein
MATPWKASAKGLENLWKATAEAPEQAEILPIFNDFCPNSVSNACLKLGQAFEGGNRFWDAFIRNATCRSVPCGMIFSRLCVGSGGLASAAKAPIGRICTICAGRDQSGMPNTAV